MGGLEVKKQSSKLEWCIRYIPFVFSAALFILCMAMELLHIEIAGETRGVIYTTFGTFVLCLSILLNINYGRMYRLNWKAAVICTFIGFIVIFNCSSFFWTQIDIKLFGAGSIATYRSSMLLLPACLLLSRPIKEKTLQICDYLTPYFFYDHGTVTLACWVQGCCAGKTNSWGVFNPLTERAAFPLQPGIILLGVGVAFWGLEYARKHDYKAGGMVYAQSLILYGTGRYALEFMSDDLRVLGALSLHSFCSLAMVIMGGILSCYLYKQEKCKNMEEIA